MTSENAPPTIDRLLRDGLDHFSIAHSQLMAERLTTYVHEIEHWNTRVNLTTRRSTEWLIRELLYDAFHLCSVIGHPRTALDMGSGSGILGIPFAILRPATQVFSVDRTLKKIQFQNHVRRSLRLENFSCVHGRIEVIEPLGVEALLVKGFGSPGMILENGGRHLVSGGSAYLLRGSADEAEAQPGFDLARSSSYSLPGAAKEYQLFVYRKL